MVKQITDTRNGILEQQLLDYFREHVDTQPLETQRSLLKMFFLGENFSEEEPIYDVQTGNKNEPRLKVKGISFSGAYQLDAYPQFKSYLLTKLTELEMTEYKEAVEKDLEQISSSWDWNEPITKEHLGED